MENNQGKATTTAVTSPSIQNSNASLQGNPPVHPQIQYRPFRLMESSFGASTTDYPFGLEAVEESFAGLSLRSPYAPQCRSDGLGNVPVWSNNYTDYSSYGSFLSNSPRGHVLGENSSSDLYQMFSNNYSYGSRSNNPSLYRSTSSSSRAGSSESRNQKFSCLSRNQNIQNSSRTGLTYQRPSSFSARPRLEELKGMMVLLVKDQFHGQFLQRAISEGSKEEIDMIFYELIGHVEQLAHEQIGSHVVMALIEKCTDEQRTQILLRFTGGEKQFLHLCLDRYGYKSVQTLLSFLSTEEQILTVVRSLSRIAVKLTANTYGHRVIQHCLEHLSPQCNDEILNEVAHRCSEIARDQQGCCTLQQCIAFSSPNLRTRLVADIIKNAVQLSDDCFGNYVVQYVLQLREPVFTNSLVGQLEGHYASLASSKYASHVVEKCLTHTSKLNSIKVVAELIQSRNISSLLLDPFGNFVIQSALDVSEGFFVYGVLVQLIQHNYPMMCSNKYGQKVLEWFTKKGRQHDLRMYARVT